jgi:hypothetical protein
MATTCHASYPPARKIFQDVIFRLRLVSFVATTLPTTRQERPMEMTAILWGGLGGLIAFALLAVATVITILWASNCLFVEE